MKEQNIVIEKLEKVGSLLTYREDIKVLDCTIRDGGLMNNFRFDDEFVKALYNALVAAGVDYMEFGYKSSKKLFSEEEYGKWKFCEEEDIRKIVGNNDTELKISVMMDVGRVDLGSIVDKKDSVIDMVRVACYIHQIPTAIDMIENLKDKGYETTVNIMAISHASERELREALEMLSKTRVDVIYLVDSFGTYYTEEIRALSRIYLEIAKKYNKIIGVHCHNNQQLAFANTIESLTLGLSYLDCTVSSLGRGAGNCPTELLLGFLKNPKYHLRPIYNIMEKEIKSLKEKGLEWGYAPPYQITGMLNRHPKDAMKKIGKDEWYKFSDFYDDMLDGD